MNSTRDPSGSVQERKDRDYGPMIYDSYFEYDSYNESREGSFKDDRDFGVVVSRDGLGWLYVSACLEDPDDEKSDWSIRIRQEDILRQSAVGYIVRGMTKIDAVNYIRDIRSGSERVLMDLVFGFAKVTDVPHYAYYQIEEEYWEDLNGQKNDTKTEIQNARRWLGFC